MKLLQNMKKIIIAVMAGLILFISVESSASASTTCSIMFRRSYKIGGTDNYFDWTIKPGTKIINSSGYNVGYGVGCLAGGVSKKASSSKSTHFYVAVTNLSICAAYYIGANFGTYHRDEVALYMYKNSYEVMPLDSRHF